MKKDSYFNRLLIVIDDHPSAIDAAKMGISLALQLNARIAMVYAVEFSVGAIDSGILPEDVEGSEMIYARSILSMVKTSFKEVEIDEFVPVGIPSKEINRIVDLWEADMIVIAHHTHHYFSKSMEESLRHHLGIPILIIPEKS